MPSFFRTSAVAVMLLGIGVTALAQTVPEMRLLVPISLGTPVQGGFGSVWTTQLSVVNTSDRAVFMGTSDCNPVVCDPPPAPIAANVTLKFSINNPFGTRGGYIYIDGGVAGDFHATLRVQDLSRQAGTWGTTIPVVAETEFRSRKFSLLDVPVAPQFRNTLRIYGLEGTRPTTLVVRTFASVPNPGSALTHDELRSERTVIMAPTSDRYPSYAEISDLTPAVAADAPVYAVRVELEPLGGAAVWAFDSVTHNQTQHVTVIAPR